MKSLRSLACLAFLAVLATPIAIGPAAAQVGAPVGQSPPSAEALAAARDLMAVLSKDTIRQMTASMMAQIWPTIERGLRAKQPNITAAQVADLRGEYERIFLNYMNDLMADAPTLYARYFTADELRQMLAFHQSPVGQKSLRILPQLTVELFQMIMPKLQQAQGQMLDAFTKVARQKGFDI
jgi:hypothetical protein